MKANVMKKVQKRPLSKNMTHYMHVNRYGRACYDFKLNFKLCLLIVTLSYTLKKKRDPTVTHAIHFVVSEAEL